MAKQPNPRDLIADMDAHVVQQSVAVPVDDGVILPRSYGLNYSELVRQPMDTVEGFDLVTGERKHTLIGVPFIIVGATYRPGIAKNDQPANYVSIELVTADQATLMERIRAGRILDLNGTPLTEPAVGGNETLVINDGSTGIARQMTDYLHRKGLISVGQVTVDTITGGEMGTSPYDRYFEEWPLGGEQAGKGFKLMFHCPRGLRVSEYANPVSPTSMSYTYYLA